MAAWLPASAFLLFTSLLAPTFCSVVGGWLVYLIYVRPILRKLTGSQGQGSNGLQVIVCGFPRTGTVSLTSALRILGFRCFHGANLSHPTTAKRFLKAYKHDNPTDWKKLFEGFTAVADYPGTCSYKELARVFPTSKIILSTRDANDWYNSFSNTVLRHTQGYDFIVYRIVTTYGVECVSKSLYKQFFNEKPEDRDTCVKAFLQHTQDVKEHVPPEKLLVYDIDKEEGWQSLCEFLDVPVPQIPFPKSNAGENFNAAIKKYGNIYTRVFWLYAAFVACLFVYLI